MLFISEYLRGVPFCLFGGSRNPGFISGDLSEERKSALSHVSNGALWLAATFSHTPKHTLFLDWVKTSKIQQKRWDSTKLRRTSDLTTVKMSKTFGEEKRKKREIRKNWRFWPKKRKLFTNTGTTQKEWNRIWAPWVFPWTLIRL